MRSHFHAMLSELSLNTRQFSRVVSAGLVSCAGVLLGVSEAPAALIANAIPGVTAYAYHPGDNADPNGDGGVNNVVNGDGLTIGNAADPTTWVHDTAWPNGWQGQGTFVVDSAEAGSALTPGAWYIADLGATFSDLDSMHIWNVREVADRGARNLDIFLAVTPTVAPATGSAYDFSSGGWISLLNDYDLPQNLTAGPDDAAAVIDLSTIDAARYVGFRINSNYNSNFRVGFAEVQFTVVPEPGVLGLTALFGLGLAARRRR
jgi:hypothetical protein